ncbi:MAG: FtsX-like permease family protein [Ruminiclostridium sp.]|nr:FtsX-like permease family protein [Ruminiclostridium sp.]
MLAFRLSLTYFKRRKLRTLLTILSVIVSIAALVAVRGLNGSIDFVSGEIAGLLGGRAQLEVKAPLSGIDESALKVVQSINGVKNAVPFIQTITLMNESRDFVVVLGIDPEKDKEIRTYQMAEGRMPEAGKRELAVPRTLFGGQSISPGQKINLQGPSGAVEFNVVGILEDSGVASVNNSMIVFMPLDTSQDVFQMKGKISYISVVLENPKELDAIKEQLINSLNKSVDVRTPSGRRSDLDSLLGMIKGFYNMYGSLCLFLALFVVYNSISVAITEQKQQIGILRAIGWRRKDVKRLILLQAFIIGAIGSLVGIFAGGFLAQGLLNTISGSLKEWVKIDIPGIHIQTADYLANWGIGVVSCLISGWYASHRATVISPMEAIRKETSTPENSYPLWRIIAGIFLAALGTFGILVLKEFSLVSQAAPFGILLGAVLALPPLLIWLLQRLEPLTTRIFGLPGKIGAGTFRRSPRRTVLTGMPLLLGLAISFSFLSIGNSMAVTTKQWMKELIVADIVISQGTQVNGNNTASLSETLIDRVKAIDGVDSVVGLRSTSVKWNDKVLDLSAIDASEWSKFASPPMVEPGKKAALDNLAAGGGIWISENLKIKYGMQVGQKLTLPTPSGPIAFKIVGIHKDFSSMGGSAYIDRQDYSKYWKDNSVDYLDVTVDKGFEPSLVQDGIVKNLDKDFRLHVDLAADFRDNILRISQGILDIMNMVVVVALLVVAIAIANSLLISVLEGTREIGILRSVGMLQREIRRMYLLEIASLFLVGIVLAVPLSIGIFESGVLMQKTVNGWILGRYLPLAKLSGISLLMGICAWLSTLYPAWYGARLDPVKAIRSE